MLSSRADLESSVTVKVVGGLGNQLFCYFAGRYLASINNSKLVLDMSDVRSGRGAHDVTIESFNLDVEFVSREARFMNNLSTRVLQKVNRLGLGSESTNYFSRVIGFDSNLQFLSVPVTLHGYFQSYKYFYHERDSHFIIELRAPSAWFLELEKRIDNEPIIAVHVRKGDYEKLRDSFGLLSKDYYQSCFEKIRSAGLEFPIYVFSDDIKAARQMLENELDKDVTWVIPPVGTDPAESLMLMSKAKINVIANSTYSWWAAALNKKNNSVYAPRKWFKDLPDPQYLYPPEWTIVDSHWED